MTPTWPDDVMEDEHNIALFVLAELAWYRRQACE